METDSFFYQLLKQLPETLFELLELPAEWALAYRFDSVELKKSLRIDGLFLPNRPKLPLYFVEIQFQPLCDVLCQSICQGVLLPRRERSRPGLDGRSGVPQPDRGATAPCTL